MYSMLLGQDYQWVDTKGISYIEGNVTPLDAEKYALADARWNAISKVVGIEVHGSAFWFQNEIVSKDQNRIAEAFSKISLEMVRGHILDEVNVEKNTMLDENGRPYIQVTFRAKVSRETRKRDSSFQITLDLGMESFRDGEEMFIEVTTTKDYYLTLFNFLSIDSVIVLFPASPGASNFIKAGTPFITGPLEVSLLPERSEDSELIVAVGSQKSYPFFSETERYWGNNVLPSYISAGKELARWIAEIPDEQPAVSTKSFRIIR